MASYSYKLFDKDGHELDLGDVENRAAWYGHGDSAEAAFVNKHGAQLGVALNPSKAHDKAAPDLIYSSHFADLKHQATPLFTAKKHYKIDPTYAVTFNLKDALEYGEFGKNHKDFTIFYWVDWVALRMEMGDRSYEAQPVQGVWMVPFSQLNQLRTGAPIHWYNRRWKVSEDNPVNATRLSKFEPRLAEGGTVYSIRGKGGNAACSYVFDLNQFQRIV